MARRIDSDDIRNAPPVDLSAAAELGDKEKWRARYDGEHDRWRGVDVRMISIPAEQLSLERIALLKRARALQSIEHPGIDTLKDFWLDEEAMLCVFDAGTHQSLSDWLTAHPALDKLHTDFVREYIGMLIYARALSTPQDLHQFQNYLYVSKSQGEPKLHLGAEFCVDILKRDETIATESELIEDACAFAKQVGHELSGTFPSLHKLRNSLRDKTSHA